MLNRKTVLTLGLAVLLIGSSSIAMADVITFNFGFSGSKVDVSAAGLTVKNALNLTLSDADNGALVAPFWGSVSLSTGAAAPTTYSNGSNIISAFYTAGGQVEVDSALNCPSGPMPGVCLTGFLNGNGTYATTASRSASFQGLFVVTYVSPDVFTALGLPWNTAWIATSGSDSITTGQNTRVTSTTGVATLGGGTITFQTVPEPGTMAMFGTGILSLAGLIRRRR